MVDPLSLPTRPFYFNQVPWLRVCQKKFETGPSKCAIIIMCVGEGAGSGDWAPQKYRAMLCTSGPCCAPSICIVHHAQRRPIYLTSCHVRYGPPTRWRTMWCCQSRCVWGEGLWEVHCAPLQRYRVMLCTIDLRCGPVMCCAPWCTRQTNVPTYTLVVNNVALYLLGGAQDYFAWTLSVPTIMMMVHNTLLSV